MACLVSSEEVVLAHKTVKKRIVRLKARSLSSSSSATSASLIIFEYTERARFTKPVGIPTTDLFFSNKLLSVSQGSISSEILGCGNSSGSCLTSTCAEGGEFEIGLSKKVL